MGRQIIRLIGGPEYPRLALANLALAAPGLVLLLIISVISTGCQNLYPPTLGETPKGSAAQNTTSIRANDLPTTPQPGLPASNITPTLPAPSELTTPLETPALSTETPGSPTATLNTATATATFTPLPAPCVLAQDLMPAQETTRLPGESFTHLWRLRNIGSCTWWSDYAIAWSSGETYASPLTVNIGAGVSPGEVVELNVPMLAPLETGDYVGVWAFVNPQGEKVDIAANSTDLLSVRVRVQSNPTPSVTATTGSLSGRVTRNGVPVQAGIAILLEDQVNNNLMTVTTAQDGRFMFSNVPVSNQAYNVAFAKELNPQYSSEQVVSWAWLGPILVSNEEQESLPDLEIDPLGFEQTRPLSNATVSAAAISPSTPLRFEWQPYPSATSYWVNLTRGDRQFSVWVSAFSSVPVVFFDGTLYDGTHIQSGEFWWAVSAQRPSSGYTLTVISPMIPLTVTQ